MAINTGTLFARAQRLVEQAVRSSGTRVRFSTVTRVTDPATRAVAESETTLFEVLAIVTSASGSASVELAPGVMIRPTDLKVTLMATVDDVPVGRFMSVIRCRDARFLNASGKVLGGVRSSAGAAYIVYVRPELPTAA